MKHLPLIVLLLLVSCGGHSDKKKKSVRGIPVVLVEGTLPDTTGTVITPPGPVTEITETESETEPETVTEVDQDIDPDIVVVEESDKLVCDFTKDSEKETFILDISEENSQKYAVLSDENGKGKAVFGGFILSPSGNEQAAVHHTDKDFSIEEGKVIKITARILFNPSTKTGELQVSYRVKVDKKVIDLDYETLADIDNCTSL